eukprot:COSAG01_NODE_5729_length_4071_cov_9.539023_1_plen_221_part_00
MIGSDRIQQQVLLVRCAAAAYGRDILHQARGGRAAISRHRRFGYISTSMVKVAQLEVGGEQITGLVAHFGAGADSHQRQPPQPPRPLPLLRGLRAVHTSPPMAEGPLTNGAALRGAIAGVPSPVPRPAPTFRGRLVKHCGQDVLLQLPASQPACCLRACLLAQHSMCTRRPAVAVAKRGVVPAVIKARRAQEVGLAMPLPLPLPPARCSALLPAAALRCG